MIYKSKPNFQNHPFHLVSPSPWPLYTSVSLFILATSTTLFFHGFEFFTYLVIFSLLNTIYTLSLWFRDIISEGTYLGNHTSAVQKGLNIGVGLFIVSEAFFFLAIFWAFFHSSIAPNIELGAQWPPVGIQGVNPFELPLLNTIILLSSGVTITYAHHSLIQGNRKGALYGTLVTVLLAGIFTFFQGVEYTVSSFTISDGIYGSCFYVGTGFHGLTYVAPTSLFIFILFNKIINKEDKMSNQIKNSSLIVESNNKSIKLDKNFIHWLVGFTDAEGNFSISLKGLKNNTYNSLNLIYQIGLHIDDLQVLEYIKDKLNCGSISKSGDRCNYFVNDQKSLINVILPLFNYMELKSSKYFQYLIFEKAVNMLINKEHLTPKGRLKMLEYYKEIKIINMNSTARENMEIDQYWLIGFTEGDATFSTNKLVPRLRFENHIKELNLFNSILNFFKKGNLSENKKNTRKSVILEINNIHVLFNTVLPLYTNFMLTKKSLDFVDWSNIVKIYYYGYHTLSEGIELINLIKSQMNNYRLSTNSAIKIDKNLILEKLNYLFNLLSPYEIKNNIRFIRGTDKLVSEKLNIIVEDINGNIQYFNSIWDCSLQINISRKIIKNCLITGTPYKDYTFKFDTYIK